MEAFEKKIIRRAAGLCANCGHAKCTCKKPKNMDLPAGITRRGTRGVGHAK